MKIVRGVLVGLGMLVGGVLIYLITIIFAPILSVAAQPITDQKKKGVDCNRPPTYRYDVQFAVCALNISAWLYLPKDTSRAVPCVVMSHGFGGTKDCILERYAKRFVEAGYAVLTYDYRHFGDSEGLPRQLFATTTQLDDLRAAIEYARSRREIDAGNILLWGTSASGGYGLIIAAEDARIAAVIAQCAGIDHKADSKMFMDREGLVYFLRLLMHAQRDKGRSRFGLSSHTFPIAGRPGTTAMFTAPGALDGYARLMQDSKTFKNEVCARLFFMTHGPDPLESSKKVHCPTLFLACEQDNLAAPNSYVPAAEALGGLAEVKTYPIGHFDIYEGARFENAMNEMLNFMKMHLR
jgi:pimeloyl-ACP methyl ester carboxylesterase